MLRDILYRLRALLRRSSAERDLDDELRFHMEEQASKHIRSGLTPEQAIRRTRIDFRAENVKEECRQAWGLTLLVSLQQDAAYALRWLRKSPGFTFTAVTSLALGIGANTTIFSLMNGTLHGELPFAESDRVVILWNVAVDNPVGRAYSVTPRNYLAWVADATSFSAMGGWYNYATKLGADQNNGQAERLRGQALSASMWDVAGMRPALGRVFGEHEDSDGHPAPVVVVSFDFWKSHLGGTSDIIGRQVRINDRNLTVIGVMPQGFRIADRADLWTPLGLTREQIAANEGWVVVAARLKDGVALRRAQAEMESIGANLRREFPKENRGLGVRVEPIQEALFYRLQEPLWILQATVAVVLLIACANVAGLLMARASARRSEIALRTAVGADSNRIIRQMLTESATLSGLGASLGLAIAWAALRVIRATLPPDNLPGSAFAIDTSVLAFTVLVSMATCLAFGLFPAVKSADVDLATAFKQSDRVSTPAGGHQDVMGLLVAVQFGLAVVLLVGAGLMGKSFIGIMSNDLGVDTTHLLTFDLNLEQPEVGKPIGRSRNGNLIEVSPKAGLVFQRVFERMQSVPGIESAAALNTAPLYGNAPRIGFRVLGQESQVENSERKAIYHATTPYYFLTMKMDLLQGRDFVAADTAAAPPVAVINSAMADRWFANQNPLGQSIVLDYAPDEPPRAIIGVVSNSLNQRYQQRPEPTVFVPHLQQSPRWPVEAVPLRSQMVFILRTTDQPSTVIPAVRRALAEVEPNLPADNLRSVEQFLDERVGQARIFMVLIFVFGTVAAMLAGIGIYGVLSYAVSQRLREIGIRIALGAGNSDVVALVSRELLRWIITGMLLGLIGAALITPILTSYLWTVNRFDPATYFSVAVVLVAVALTASYIPARRAARVDPVTALHSE